MTAKMMRPGLCAVLLLTNLQARGDWPQWGGPQSNYQVPAGELADADLAVAWQREIGLGTSGILVAGDVLYTQVAVAQPGDAQRYREGFIALDRGTGRTLWTYDYETDRHADQQTFGGAGLQPQATPAIAGDTLVGLGFTGVLSGVDRRDGSLRWQLDLVKSLNAPPVQFGFAASPLIHDNRVFVLAGGSDGGLLCLQPEDGRVLWKLGCKQASYATPIVLRIAGKTQIVAQSDEALFAADPTSGQLLWRHPLPKPGMTNVPTPLDAGGGRLLVSGQGWGGTRLLQVAYADGKHTVTQQWSNRRMEFFYSNWLARGDYAYGCDGRVLVGLHLDSGVAAWRSRGAGESNLVATGNQAWVLHGKQGLSRMRLAGVDTGVTWHSEFDTGRSWAAPTIAGRDLLLRSEQRLMCLRPATGDTAPLSRSDWEHEAVIDRSVTRVAATEDPLTRILDTFSSGGPEAAWQVYQRIHAEKPATLTAAQRLELATLADAEGLREYAHRVLRDAADVYPQSEQVQAALRASQAREGEQP